MNDRERATALAALRLWQQQLTTGVPAELMDIARERHRFSELDREEIGQLCERLNTSESANADIELAGLWEEATGLQDGHAGQESPLTRAIFQETLEASEDGDHNPQDMANALSKIAEDCEKTADLIRERHAGQAY